MMIGDATTSGLQAALHALDTRRAAHEANIANIETPGYKARSVEFESELRRAMESGSGFVSGVEAEVSVSNEPGRVNGNNVNVGNEMVSLTEAALTQELLIRAMNDKYGLVRTALGNG
jgi:flagellar basal-body rod protein FlgB